MKDEKKVLLSGNEAVAIGAIHAAIDLGVGYPGTPSSEILENFSDNGGKAIWASNEKVALETGIGVGFANGRSLVTMKHVGVNVAADPLFTLAYTGTSGAIVLVVADDPGMASSQNEQDTRRYAYSAGIPMLEPSDSQEAYEYTIKAVELSEKFKTCVILRLTTRICHSKTIVNLKEQHSPKSQPGYQKDIKSKVMVPAYARPAHKKLRKNLEQIKKYSEKCELNKVEINDKTLGIITSGISYEHCKEVSPSASFLKLGLTHPLPLEMVKNFKNQVEKLIVIEEGDPYIVESLKANDINVNGKQENFRFGELNVNRVAQIINGVNDEDFVPPKGKPPQLCLGCPHRSVFEVLKELGCIVCGDIGCYTLGVLPPFEAMDTCVCMGASIGVGLGMRHVLPENEAKKVVSVIGDGTFMHSGLTGLVDMFYNKPKLGHLVIIMDNQTTAMTGLQEHPATGRSLDHKESNQIIIENVVKAMGIDKVEVCDPFKEKEKLKTLVSQFMESTQTSVIITRRSCILTAKKIKQYQLSDKD